MSLSVFVSSVACAFTDCRVGDAFHVHELVVTTNLKQESYGGLSVQQLKKNMLCTDVVRVGTTEPSIASHHVLQNCFREDHFDCRKRAYRRGPLVLKLLRCTVVAY